MIAKQWKPLVFGIILGVCLASWLLLLGTVLLFDTPSLAVWTAMVTAAAVSTEAMLWTGVLLLGWSMFKNRRSLWAKLTGKNGRI